MQEVCGFRHQPSHSERDGDLSAGFVQVDGSSITVVVVVVVVSEGALEGVQFDVDGP